MSDLLKSLIKESGNEFAGIAADGIDKHRKSCIQRTLIGFTLWWYA